MSDVAETAFVRQELVPERPAPIKTTGFVGFLRTRLFTHVFGGAVEAQKLSADIQKEECERLQQARAAGTAAEGGALLAQFHRRLDEAYAGNS